MKIKNGSELPDKLLENYLLNLISRFFKILPIKESGEPSLKEYMRSLQAELMGFETLMEASGFDPIVLSLIATLEYMANNNCETAIIKREVFKAISLIKKLNSKYFSGEVKRHGNME